MSSTTTSGADPRSVRSRATLAAAAVVATLAGAACATPVESAPGVSLAGEVMGTSFSVRVADADPEAEASITELVRAELDAVDRAMSTWKPDSEISRFNRSPAGEPFELSQPTFEVVATALSIGLATGGAFDVTVGPMVDAWGFGPAGAVTTVPNETEIERLRAMVGSHLLSLDEERRTLTKSVPGVHLDLSAIAKGYAVDRVSAALAAAGHGNTMVEVGGEVVTRGRPVPDRPWRIGIENPAGGIQRLVGLRDAALASSGDYRAFYEFEGRRVGHTIDPRTGRPVAHAARAVSVVADDCATADALATALMVMGPDEGLAWAEDHGIAALFLVDESGSVQERASSTFASRTQALQ